MATASRKNPPTSPAPRKVSEGRAAESPAAADHWVLRGFDATYRFLASVKLAVLCILTLAMVLAGATFFESAYGTAASRQYVYQNPMFAILLAFLGTNVFCAATIRYPWKKRQTGFVITHVGLLVVLAGAFVSLKNSDEGQMGMAEGVTSSEIERDHFVVRVQKIEPNRDEAAGPKVLSSYVLPFIPGAFSWESDAVAALARTPGHGRWVFFLRSAVTLAGLALAAVVVGSISGRPAFLRHRTVALPLISGLLALVAGLWIVNVLTPSGPRLEVLTDKGDPFTFVVKDYLNSVNPQRTRTVADPDRDGYPVVRLALLAQPPGAKAANDSLGGEGWFAATKATHGRDSKDAGPALLAHQYLSGPRTEELVEDFLHPPADPTKDRVARFFYNGRDGRRRTFDWNMGEGKEGQSVALPDSDLTVKLADLKDVPILGNEAAGAAEIRRAVGEKLIHFALFTVRKGKGEDVKHLAIASLPTYQNSALDDTPEELVRISYFHPPNLSQGGAMSGRFGQVEVLTTEDGRAFYRGFGRKGLVGIGPIAKGKPTTVFGGDKMPMQIAVELAEALPRARLREVYPPLALPRERRDEAFPAIEAEMTVEGVTRKLSILRSIPNTGQKWDEVRFPGGTYRVCYDFDRLPLDFRIALKKFTPGKDPGSGSPATYRSEVELTDPEKGVRDEPKVITMNEPLTHRGYTFYQSRFNKVADPETGERDAVYASYFQVHYDPAWQIIYSGCLLVVVGTFVQFYMRAGVFTDGGKKERAVAEARARKNAGLTAHAESPGSDAAGDLVEDL